MCLHVPATRLFLFAQNAACFLGAFAATSGDAKALLKLAQGIRAQFGRLSDFAVGYRLANADIHRIQLTIKQDVDDRLPGKRAGAPNVIKNDSYLRSYQRVSDLTIPRRGQLHRVRCSRTIGPT